MRPCSAHPTFLPKPELTLDLTEEGLKIQSWWKTFFSKNGSLEFIPSDFIKNELHHRDYLAWVLQGTFFNILENFLRVITYFFYTENYKSAERTRTRSVRTRHLQLCKRQCLYLNADANAIANVEMQMPRFPNALLSI